MNTPSAVPLWLRAARVHQRITNPVAYLARRFICHAALTHEVKARLCIDLGAGTAPYEGPIRTAMGVETYISVDIAASDRTTIVGDALKVPLRDGCADIVVNFDVIQHVRESAAMLAEVYRLLRPGGYALLTFPFIYCECDVLDFRRWTLAGMAHDLRAAGFDVTELKRRGGMLFALTCGLTWAVQHAFPGGRRNWRSARDAKSIALYGLIAVVTTPTSALQWIALLVDRCFKPGGCYMGGAVLAKKPERTELER